MKTLFVKLMVALLAGLAAGCERQRQSTGRGETASVAAKPVSLPPGLLVNSAPAGARSVGEVKADLDTAGQVVVRGRIGGRRDPFVDGVAMFLLADDSLKPCNERHGDGCPTPWDYCCESREAMAAGTATIQVLGDDGKPLGLSIKGVAGLDPLTEVTVVGEVASRSDTSTLVITAEQLFVHANGD